MIYFLKHVDSITAMVRRPDLPQSEEMTGRFADALNYIKLLYALLKEREYDTVEPDHGMRAVPAGTIERSMTKEKE